MGLVAQENVFAEMKEELMKMQKSLIQTEIAKPRNNEIFREIDCSEVKHCVLDDFDTLATEIDTIKEKPRFVAEIRPPTSFYYLPVGNITGYDELIDVGSNFSPESGVFTSPDDATYVFIVDSQKSGQYGNFGAIWINVNGDHTQDVWEKDAEHGLHLNGLTAVNLKRGDEVNVFNAMADSVEVYCDGPFTFIGYQV